MEPTTSFKPIIPLPSLKHPKEGKYYDPVKYETNHIEYILKEVVSGKYDSLEALSLVRLFRIMSRDPKWCKENASTATKVMRSVSYWFVMSNDSRISEKIKKIVRLQLKNLGGFVVSDLKIRILGVSKVSKTPPQTIFVNSLLIACQSSYFTQLFKSEYKEGKSFKEHLTNDNLPEVTIESVSGPILRAFFAILQFEKHEPVKHFSQEDLQNLCCYADMTDALDDFLPKLEKIIKEDLEQYPAKALLWHEFAVYNDFMPETQLSCISHTLIAIEESANPVDSLKKFLSKASGFKSWDPIIPELMVKLEQRLAEDITIANIEFLYSLVLRYNLKHLHQACLHHVGGKLDESLAFLGICRESLLQFNYLSKADLRDVCVNFILDKLPEWFGSVDHEWDPDLEKFIEKGSDRHDLLEKLNRFAEVAPRIQQIRKSHLSRLSTQDVEWMLTRISPDVIELNLSNSKLRNIYLLDRFQKLEKLDLSFFEGIYMLESLNELKSLKDLDVSNCPNLFSPGTMNLPKLENIRLNNTKLENPDTP